MRSPTASDAARSSAYSVAPAQFSLRACPALRLVHGGAVAHQRQRHEVNHPLALRGMPVVTQPAARSGGAAAARAVMRGIRASVGASKATRPSSGASRPAARRSSVDLPAAPRAEDPDVLAAVDLEGGVLEHHGLPPSVGVGLADLLEAEQRRGRRRYRRGPACSSIRRRVRLAHSTSRAQLGVGGVAHDLHHQPHPRAHRQRRAGALTQQLQALALVLAQREQQLGRVLLARRRDLRLNLCARGLAGGERFQPQPQRLGGEVGGAVDGAVLARVLGVALDRARDQTRPLELVEHPVEALGVDRPRRPQARARGGRPGRSRDRDAPARGRGSPPSGARTRASTCGRRLPPRRLRRELVIDSCRVVSVDIVSRSSLRRPLRSTAATLHQTAPKCSALKNLSNRRELPDAAAEGTA